MGKGTVVLGCFIGMPPGSDVTFAADNRLDARFYGFLVKFERTEHRPVIGERHRPHAKIGRTSEQIIDAHGTVEQTVLGMNMQVNEIGCFSSHGLFDSFSIEGFDREECEASARRCLLRVASYSIGNAAVETRNVSHINNTKKTRGKP
jgi:hypothetical protein